MHVHASEGWICTARKMQGSVLLWHRAEKAHKWHPGNATAGREYVAPAAKAAATDDMGEAEAAAIEVGARCCVEPGERRGEVRSCLLCCRHILLGL